MFEELRNKKVKMIVGTNSGISVGAGAAVAASFLTVFGTFSDYDDQMIKLSDVQVLGAIPGEISVGFGGAVFQASKEETSIIYVSRANIVAISVLGE